MAYEKHTWQTGEVITAEKLNNLEDGCSNLSLTQLTISFQHAADEYGYLPIVLTSGSETIRGQLNIFDNDAETGKVLYGVLLYKDGTVDDIDYPHDSNHTEEEEQALTVKTNKALGAVEYILKKSSDSGYYYETLEDNLAALYKAKFGRDYISDLNKAKATGDPSALSSDPITVFF